MLHVAAVLDKYTWLEMIVRFYCIFNPVNKWDVAVLKITKTAGTDDSGIPN